MTLNKTNITELAFCFSDNVNTKTTVTVAVIRNPNRKTPEQINDDLARKQAEHFAATGNYPINLN
jgi:hypothetical protein